MDLINELRARGLVENASADLEKIFSEKRTVYLGVDPSADSMQIGNLSAIILMKRLSDAGHTPILLVGGGTGLIGDPRERGERPLQTEDIVATRAKNIHQQFQQILRNSDAVMVNNVEWLRELKLLPFLRDVGKHFSVNELIKKDIIRRRLETPDESISYTEFTYSLLQAYDYWELNKRYNCDLQIGGSDQWTNILSGVELVRKREGKEVFALAIPLVTDAAGRKFGKSEGNAVWLDKEKTSPYQFYQFWLNTDDAKVIDYLKAYTFLSLQDIEDLAREQSAKPGSRLAQKKLAAHVTAFVHGENATLSAETVSRLLFEGGDISSISGREKEMLLQNAPVFRGGKGKPLVDVLVESGLAASKREAREFINDGAVTLSDVKMTDPEATIDFNEVAILKRGKKNLVVLVE